MELDWDDLVVDKSAVKATAEALLEEWLWLIPDDADPMLPTACGDMFLRLSDGSIALLDTYAGTCTPLAADYEKWKSMLNNPAQLDQWFRGDLLVELLEAGLQREPGWCFSPLVPQIIGGSWEPSNFHPCDLLVHFSMLGQIHNQVKDLPPGTRISGFKVVEE